MRDDRHVVRGPLPAPAVPDHVHAGERAAQVFADPDMIEAAALVGRGPIGRPVAPPRIEFFVGRYVMA